MSNRRSRNRQRIPRRSMNSGGNTYSAADVQLLSRALTQHWEVPEEFLQRLPRWALGILRDHRQPVAYRRSAALILQRLRERGQLPDAYVSIVRKEGVTRWGDFS